jgi:vacuolar-type H+-ATPase subunit H
MSVDTAMSRVLAAERDAVDQLAASESDAHDIVREAREFVRALVRRHHARLSRLHADCAATTSELVKQLEEAAADRDAESCSTADGQRRLEDAVARVARELTEKADAN